MTTEDKVRETAERIRQLYAPAVETKPPGVEWLERELTTFALDQQRVGMKMATDTCAGFVCNMCNRGNTFPLSKEPIYKPAYYEPEDMEFQHHTSNGNVTCKADGMRMAIRALEPIPAPGKGEV